MALPLMGPRNSVVAAYLRGDDSRFLVDIEDVLTDPSPWVVLNYRNTRWDDIKNDFPELWVDKLHDYVWEDDE